MIDLEKTSLQEWIRRRVNAVHERYTAFDCLAENGISDVPDETTPTQIKCPFHGEDNRPSGRYYPRSGGRPSYVRCFKCKENWDGLNLHAKFKKMRFMDALTDLERRYRIKIPRRPGAPDFKDLVDKNASYVSDKWGDVPQVMKILETKLARLRDKCAMSDYVKFCRVMDHVAYDYDKIQKSDPEMVKALLTLRNRMDEASMITDDMFQTEDATG